MPTRALVGLLAFASASAFAADTFSVPSKRPPDQEVAQALWVQSCAECHGAKGLGDGALAAALGGVESLNGRISTDNINAIIDVVRNGKGKMPAYSETIDAGDARRILEWIRDISSGKIQPKVPTPPKPPAPPTPLKATTPADDEAKSEVKAEAADEE